MSTEITPCWVVQSAGNQILERSDFSISYAPLNRLNDNRVTSSFGMFGDIFELNNEETAIIYKRQEKPEYRILNGDFRREYEKLETLDECLAFYESKKEEFGSKWSTE